MDPEITQLRRKVADLENHIDMLMIFMANWVQMREPELDRESRFVIAASGKDFNCMVDQIRTDRADSST